MQTRRYKPFRKQPPMRRRAQLYRLQGASWETVEDEEECEEEPEPLWIPTPRVPIHDQDPEPESKSAPYDEEPARRRPGRWVLVAGTAGVIVTALVVGALILARGSSSNPTRPDQAP
ncbi:MAG: hypothetical protein JWO46_1775, partial [Nocardioidaceae bacterium]|nr:hypothetical protein [Nocardioidaceae bacterium]